MGFVPTALALTVDYFDTPQGAVQLAATEFTRQLSLAGVKNAEEVGLVLGKADTGLELSLQEAQSLAECPPALDLMIGNYLVTDLSLHPTGEEIQVAVQQTRHLLDS